MLKKAPYIRPGSPEPNTLAVTKSGRINLSRDFVKEYGLKKSMGAAIYWDEADRKIAFALTKKDHQGSYPLVFTPTGRTAFIVAIQFFRSHRLDPRHYAVRYAFEVSQPKRLGIAGVEGDVFVVDLKEPVR
jgi:hypothetical protein